MKEMEDDSEDIFTQNSTDKYINRPDTLEDLVLQISIRTLNHATIKLKTLLKTNVENTGSSAKSNVQLEYILITLSILLIYTILKWFYL